MSGMKNHYNKPDDIIFEVSPYAKPEPLGISLPEMVKYCKNNNIDLQSLTENDLKRFREMFPPSPKAK